MKNICSRCKKTFKRTNNSQKFCTKKCQASSTAAREYQRRYRQLFKSLGDKNIITRHCLRCGDKFKALGRFNRICYPCKKVDTWKAQL